MTVYVGSLQRVRPESLQRNWFDERSFSWRMQSIERISRFTLNIYHALSLTQEMKNGHAERRRGKVQKYSCEKHGKVGAVKRKRASSGSGDDASVASAVRQGGFTIMYYANPGTLCPA